MHSQTAPKDAYVRHDLATKQWFIVGKEYRLKLTKGREVGGRMLEPSTRRASGCLLPGEV